MIRRTTWAKLSIAQIARSIGKSFGLPMLGGILASGSLLWLFSWLAAEVFEGEWQAFDDAVRNTIHQAASPFLTRVMTVASFLGSPVVLSVFAAVALAVLWYAKWKRAAALLALTMAGEVLLDICLKGFYARPRPEPFLDYILPASFSFPSGHALGSFCFYGILAWLVSSRIKNRAAAWGMRFLAICLVLVIGISRIYFGVHFPSDVIAGYLAGFVWIFTVLLAEYYLDRKNKKDANA